MSEPEAAVPPAGQFRLGLNDTLKLVREGGITGVQAALAGERFCAAMDELLARTGPSPEEVRSLRDGILQMAEVAKPIPAPQIRMVGDRRMQCKDIPDEAFLDAAHRPKVWKRVNKRPSRVANLLRRWRR